MSEFAKSFEELEIWKKARNLIREIYQELVQCRDFSFRDQIQRASLSVMNNIAEGFERRTSKDFAHFLDLAKGSCGEVRSMLYAAEDLGYLATSKAEALRSNYISLSKAIAAFTRHLRK